MQSFPDLPFNCTHIIIKGIIIWGVRWPGVRGDMASNIFLLSKLNSLAGMAWHRVLLSDVGFSRSHPLDPDQHYLLQTHLMYASVLRLRHNIIIASDHPKHNDVYWWGQSKPMVVQWVHHLILVSSWRDAWVYSKALQHGFSSCPLGAMIKIGLFSSCLRNTECLHALLAW